MKVKCAICETIDDLKSSDPLAKKLRNRPIHTYLCDECYERVKIRTEKRRATGHFRLYRDPKNNHEL
ncbi:YlaI family protein [Bacillus piscicola]|uniref:YlaI family protein n=1 Tax=Bacillus piscicola TaxID=1632684 RepID=UPI001F097FAB|nr:YlaI family protein [Bacillus piscicola]